MTHREPGIWDHIPRYWQPGDPWTAEMSMWMLRSWFKWNPPQAKIYSRLDHERRRAQDVRLPPWEIFRDAVIAEHPEYSQVFQD